jgi:O-acetyl-ADP-ribose deacetylase (regulator of RNase III)
MRIELLLGDITDLDVDCIVNAARPSLMGGGGVDGAIHKKAGIELAEYCKSLGGCKVGEAKLSPGFSLKSKNIIHTVGPRYLFKKQKEEDDLANCYYQSLLIAKEKKFQILVFPNISTGAYGYPKDLASRIAFNTTSKFLFENDFPNKVIFCCFDIENMELYLELLKSQPR